MALTNYTELKSAIADWLNRDDLTSVIPTFISLAEVGMERVLRTRNMLVRANAPIDTQYSAVPANFLEIRTIKLTSVSPIQPMEFQTMDAMDVLDGITPGTGRPLYYTVVGTQLRVHPRPAAVYTAELAYYARLDKLSDTLTSNWILTKSPDAYLYGALLQAAPYLKDDERMNVWASLYAAAIQAMQTADDRASTAGGALKTRSKPFGVN
tara:strand:- start:27 stop:656 length:630 start_codon:yes stop_codon:yes gene_type:complete